MKKVMLLIIALLFTVSCSVDLAPVEDWRSAELVDVSTIEAFTIEDFSGKFVILESFAVWCPTCTEQQKEMKKLHELREDVVSISLDTDPNEDAEKVLEHIESNGFDWYYAISPINVTTALIDEFGLTVVNAPSAPVILICEDQSFRFLDSGVKEAEDLIEEIEVGCNVE